MQKFAASKIPVYLSFAAGAEALSAVVKYNERRRARRAN